ncbi:stromal cell-derived factor 2-like protein precursor [Actinidia rufa]|uniref:Stromal cell-derived factor 2-like protein n=1 Tax=Actinidia rufa TaxID=165716 RepID=A0A7J0H2C2_9ERIC|nr:stromal cell-derived factor 2-like protein precursor [Actinidia rufa]
MAFSFFAIAIFLFLTLDSDYALPVSAASEGVQITYGSVIKLMHERTKFRLHSHDVPYGSGSGQQSVTGFPNVDDSNSYWVSCFGGEGESDTGDYWRLEIEGSGKTWRQDQRIRLHHVDTNGYLHSHDKKYQRIAGGQQEVCGVREKRADNVWLAGEGVYLPVMESK